MNSPLKTLVYLVLSLVVGTLGGCVAGGRTLPVLLGSLVASALSFGVSWASKKFSLGKAKA